MRYFLLIFLAFFILSCVSYSDTPLTDPKPKKLDLSVCGTWLSKDDNESGYIHAGIDKKTKLLKVLMINYNKFGEIEISEFSGHTSRLKNNRYLNLKWVQPKDENPGYLFIKYIIKEEALWISIINPSPLEKAIVDGSLKGVIKSNGSSYVHITENQKKLQKFILKNDKILFKEMKKLNKLELPGSVKKGVHLKSREAPAEGGIFSALRQIFES